MIGIRRWCQSSRLWLLAWLAAWAIAGAALVVAQSSSGVGADVLQALKYRHIGPVGNRVIAVHGIPGNPWIYYAGAASGGLWKTTDGGVHWQAIFDDQPVSSVAALAIAATDPNVVWVGTGEAFIRSNISIGNGVYRSTDAGRTWAHVGLENTGRISRILADPRNPDVALVCALGHAYGPQPDRGVFRTADGGRSWQKVLFVDEKTGCSDIAMDPTNPRILFAGMWQLEIHTWGRTSGGPGSGLYTSRDGGTTWQRIQGHGLPAGLIGKVTMAIAPSNPRRIYALIETGDGVVSLDDRPPDRGELWRSDDGGENWQVVSYDRQLAGRTHYYARHAVSPDNDLEAYFLSASYSKTIDGGRTTIDSPFGQSPGGDNHDMWIDPTNGDRMIVANDAGVSITVNRGTTWHRQQLPIAQMYHVHTDNAIPYNVLGNRQDGPSTRGPSNSLLGGFGPFGAGIPRGDWHAVGGGESGFAVPDPTDSNIVWASGTGLGSVGGVVERFDERNRQTRWVEVWPEQTVGAPGGEVKYRFNWTFPVTLSPHDRNTVYVGSQHVHRTTDGGNSWQVISPDLTLNDKSHLAFSGGLTGDNLGVEYAGVVFAIAESPKERGLIWAGTNDGQLHVTRDGGKQWTNVTANLPGLPPLGTVSNVEPSRYDPATAYVTFDLHQVNNRDPFVFKTTDYGRTWTSISAGVPKTVFSYAHCIREDPVRRGLLYLGTENALYVSFDDGRAWVAFQTNLPHAPVHWMTIQEHFNDLVVATYGRGFWIADDITPLQQLTDQVLASEAHLFVPRPAYRFRERTSPMTMSDDQTAGRNPPYGASITYYLKNAAPEEVAVTIADASGATIRSLKGPKERGLNRVTWDLRYDPTTEIRLRTSPIGSPDVRVGPDGWRPYPGGGFGGGARINVLAPPGTYTVKIAVGGKDLSQPLVVRKDPNATGTDADIQTQTRQSLAIRGDFNQTASAINQIEAVRAQLVQLVQTLEGDPAARTAAQDVDRKLVAIEETLFQMRLTGRGQDSFRFPPKMIEKLAYLANGVDTADFAPTTQQVQVYEQLHEQGGTVRTQLDQVLKQDLGALNKMLRDKNVPNIVVR